MEKAAVGASADLIDDVGLKISVDGTWNIFSLASLGEESAESVVRVFLLAFFGQVSIGLDAVLKAVKLPAGIGDLTTGLADVQTNDFSHLVIGNGGILAAKAIA
jgi:hypothetical protein